MPITMSLFAGRASEVSCASWSNCRQNGQASDGQVVFHVVDERRCHVTTQQKNPFGFMDSCRNPQYLLQIDVVQNESEVLLDLLPRIFEELRRLGGVSGGLHAVQNGCAGDGQIVKIMLKILITFKSEARTTRTIVVGAVASRGPYLAHSIGQTRVGFRERAG